MRKVNSVEEYIETNSKWSEALSLLRSIIISTELEETLKWSIPTYTIKGKNVCGIGAFKDHFGIWFFNGVFLKDEHKILRNAQDGKTKAMRQLRFTSIGEVNKKVVLQYVMEAIENQKLGKEVKPDRSKKETLIPEELKKLFESNNELKSSFDSLTPYKQREYCEYIQTAKREATKQSRILKITPMILQGVGLHDKYKNC
ncbi:YdeI/OmpD-associated family protein [Seonamhaeicola maritimus]|uniref:YdeI/OmpD-associated family protein n=1 Tax=Seonamhaeicola maritimus TaxID=2591822 RepID=UPI002494112E|nr:YdeI/OmpD-associated family protein [Seonamhaeicola maritimus]